MSFSSDELHSALTALSEDTETPRRFIVAFSGGLDSTVLLHALLSAVGQTPVLAVHVDHGLQENSAAWAEQCALAAASFGVESRQLRVTVDTQSGKGLEAAARDARYSALAELMLPGDWLLSAHHQEDQAETLLLNLLRGSGPTGLAGIARIRPFAGGWLARPLLSFSQDALRDYAAKHELTWVDDPSNDDLAFDRNYLRHEILPKLESRWPGTAQRLYRSSRIAADAASLLDDLAAADAATVGDRLDRLRVDGMKLLAPERQRNILRFAIRQLGYPAASAAHLQRALDEVLYAREDAEPLLTWGGIEVRRFRNHLYLLAAADAPAAAASSSVDPVCVGSVRCLELGTGRGVIRFEEGADLGLDSALVAGGLQLRYRQGGEKIKPVDQRHTRTLKKLLQDENIVPWMRDRIPLLFAGEQLVAVADLWLASDAVKRPGVAIHWEKRPPIH